MSGGPLYIKFSSKNTFKSNIVQGYMGFISSRAKLGNVILGPNATILGPSIIGDGTFIDDYVTLGYPVRAKLRTIKGLNELDELSGGVTVGENCIIRRGAVIYENVSIGNNVEFGHSVLVRENTVIGDGSRIGTLTVIDGYVKIGARVNIQSMVYIPIGTVIEDDVFIGPNAVITNDKYPPSRRLQGVVIRRGAVIGANATLIAGIEVGENSVVAAGAVVTRNVPPNTVVAGVPAKPLYSVEEYVRRRSAYEAEVAGG